jgi:hypothetical protein
MQTKVRDFIEFENDSGPHQGYVMWYNNDGTVQVSDGGDMKCQNWVIQPSQITHIIMRYEKQND